MNILLFSNLFPNPLEPERGRMALEKIRVLRQWHDFRVVSPLPWFSVRPSTNKAASLPECDELEGIPVWYPRVPHIPVVGRRWIPKSMLRVVSPLVTSLHAQKPFHLIWATWGYPDVVVGVQLAERLGVPVVGEFHGSDVNQGLQTRWIGDTMLRSFTACRSLIVRSEAMRQTLFYEGVEEAKLVCIYNGVDHHRFQPGDRTEACAKLGWPKEIERVLYVGSLAESKGVLDLLAAHARIRSGGNNRLELVLVGFGPLTTTLEREIQQRRVSSSVRLLGRVPHSDLPVIYNACDLFCLPSYNEGMPNVILEAQACGLPVVATNVGAVPDLIPDTRFGFLYDPGDLAALEDRLQRALQWPFDRAEILRRSQLFTWERAAELYHQVFQHAVGQGERPGTTQLQLGASKRISFRVRFYTQSYPHPENPIAGAFNRHIARALRSQVYLEVVVPISHLEARRPAPMLRWQDGLLIRHPRFLGIRGLNRIFAGCSLAQALQGRPCRAEILMASPAWPEGYAVVRRARECKRPCIVNVIGSDVNRLPPWGPRHSQTLWALRNSDHIYAVSFALRERLIALGIPASKITVIHNGVDGRLFFPRPAEPVRRELGLPVERRVLLFAGNVIHEKGADDLLEALASIRREQRPLLLLVGPCPEPMRYGQFIRRLGLHADCQLVGRQDQSQMPKWYAACDLFVLPSWHEGCPNVILEALACGRPIVATNVGGIPELLNPTAMPFARLVAPHDPAALASAIVDLLGRSWDPGEIARHATRTWDDVGRELNDLLREVHARWLRQQAPLETQATVVSSAVSRGS